jgi:hypothetical protein
MTMQNSELRMQKSPFRLHPSSFILHPPRRRRRGVTIIEVLFAILITTVGLFSALAIFPFASAQARRARLNDMMAVAGRSAFHSFDVRGMRRPDRWLAWDPNVPPAGLGLPPGAFVNLFPGSTSPSTLQPFESICIDPRLIAVNTLFSGKQILAPAAQNIQWFPYFEPADLNNSGAIDPVQQQHPTVGGFPVNANNQQFDTSSMRRITLFSGNTALPAMTLFQANSIFVSTDDLSYDRPEDDKSKPANQSTILLQSAAAGSTTEWAKRNSEGQLSWIATLVPQFDVSGAPNDNYTLSIVMIHGRTDPAVDKYQERVVYGQLVGGGTGGGEIVLASKDPEQLKLKPNDWVMLSGTKFFIPPLASPPPGLKSISRFQWYRVSDCDPEPEYDDASTLYGLNATLIGADWNSDYFQAIPVPTIPGATTVRVTIVEGAHAVYEKTIRLEYGSAF